MMFYPYKLIEIRNSQRKQIAKFKRQHMAELVINSLVSFQKDWDTKFSYQLVHKNKVIISR